MKFRDSLLRSSLALALFTLISVVGCSDDGLGKRYKVTGMVTYKGAPVAKGLISFIAVAPDGRSATGEIKDGSYSMTTQDPGDGVFPGQYTVTVASRDVDYTEVNEKAKKKGNTAGYLPQGYAGEAEKKAKSLVPEKYGIPTTSPLKADVKGSSTLDFVLED